MPNPFPVGVYTKSDGGFILWNNSWYFSKLLCYIKSHNKFMLQPLKLESGELVVDGSSITTTTDLIHRILVMLTLAIVGRKRKMVIAPILIMILTRIILILLILIILILIILIQIHLLILIVKIINNPKCLEKFIKLIQSRILKP